MTTLRLESTELYYEDRGAGVPILWLQGLGADHAAWSPQLVYFASRYRCIAPDNRGSGKTAPGGYFSLDEMADDAARLVEACAPGQKAFVVGLSMGASIAMELALRAPHLVRGLVLVSASVSIEPRLRELMIAWREIYPRVSPAAFQRQANVWLFSWRFFERPKAIKAAIRYAERAAAPGDWFTAQVDAAVAHDKQERLGDIRMPTLAITGAEDDMVPPRLGRELAATIPGASFVEIPEAGHSVNLEQQRAFNQAVLGFFAAH